MIPRIGLDLDEVCYDYETTVRRLYEEDGQGDLGPGTYWDWSKSDWYAKNIASVFTEGAAIPGAVEGVQALSWLTPKLTVITKGPPEAREPKMFWLEHTGIMRFVDEFVFLPESDPKSRIRCDLYIDDMPHTVEEVFDSLPGVRMILYDQQWNRGSNAPRDNYFRTGRLMRAGEWSAVVDLTRRLAYHPEEYPWTPA